MGDESKETLECYKQSLMKCSSGSSEEQDADRNMESKDCVMGSLLEIKTPGTWTRDPLGSYSNLTYLHLIHALRFWGRLNLEMANSLISRRNLGCPAASCILLAVLARFAVRIRDKTQRNGCGNFAI